MLPKTFAHLALLFVPILSYTDAKELKVQVRKENLCKDKCVSKCCPLDLVYKRITTKTTAVGTCVSLPNATNLIIEQLLPLYNKTNEIERVNYSTEFTVLFGINCGKKPKNFFKSQIYYLQKDGELYIDLPNANPPWTLRGPDKYCIDTFVREDPTTGEVTTHLDALICFAEKQENLNYIWSSIGMLISCVFFLATVAVYGWLPELRNLHGKVLMVYLMCLFVAFAFLASMQVLLVIDNIWPKTCFWITIIIYFALESAFFWLNVMCFDIWWTFSGKRGPSTKSSKRAWFIGYSVYAFGIPSLLTILLVSLEFSGLPPHPLMPMLHDGKCFINGTSKLLYLYGPILILCIANIAFFILTAIKIAQIKKEISVLESKESSMHDQHRNDKQRFLLYMKLFTVMGINWIMEVVSALYPNIDYIWKFTDAYNVLIGLIIFIIFVCKRKIFRLIKKRYQQLQGDPMSRTQTTTSSRTLSSQIGTVKGMK